MRVMWDECSPYQIKKPLSRQRYKFKMSYQTRFTTRIKLGSRKKFRILVWERRKISLAWNRCVSSVTQKYLMRNTESFRIQIDDIFEASLLARRSWNMFAHFWMTPNLLQNFTFPELIVFELFFHYASYSDAVKCT